MENQNENNHSSILIIDGHSIAHRAYHASLATKKNFSAPDGTPTGMIFIFMNMLYKVQKDLRPDFTIIIFDSGGKTFRHELQEDYKATRKPLDEALKIQLPILQDLLTFSGHKIISRPGVEADDVVASLSKLAQAQGHEAIILSSDKDLLQILDTGIKMLRPIQRGVSDPEIYNIENFKSEYGFMPSSMIDYLAMTGDTADNVHGIEGIGEKTAKNLLAQYPTLEEIFSSIENLKTAVRKKLEACGLEHALWIRDNLIRLKDNLFDNEKNFLDDCLSLKPDNEKATALASRLALTRVLEHLKFQDSFAPVIVAPDCDEVVIDLKAELRKNPALINKKIFDLKSAYYMLHPDKMKKGFQDFIAQKNLEAMAGELNGEILNHENLNDVMNQIDLPLIPVLNKMEDRGVRLDPEKFSVTQNELQEQIFNIEQKIINDTGIKININSPKQVASLLFERLDFEPEAKTKGKTSFSTDAGVLEKLAKLPNGKIPGLILEHRELTKMLSGFVIPFQKAADSDGIIHTTFEPAFTGTGRLSSRDPNLQNIPAYGQWAEKIKAGLVPVDPEKIFVAADYSQIELRVLAHLSGEEKLIEAFKNQRDIHTETASWVFGTSPEFVTPELRRAAKMINFGLLYGMSSFGLAERLGVDRKEAGEIMKKYFEALPGIQNFLEKIIREAKQRGYSKTLAGRIRPVKEIPAIGQALDRALINSPIQGTAADIARRAMINFEAQAPGKLFLQVHDSLVCECHEDEADEIARTLEEIMRASGGEIEHLEVKIKKGKFLSNV